MLSLLDAKEN
ncbi:hypothetical protein D039_3918A, partial [Vibrio parahaemolyticus EKP-028]